MNTFAEHSPPDGRSEICAWGGNDQMMIWQWCKIQVMAILILAYVRLIYTRDGWRLNRLTRRSNCNVLFDWSLVTADAAVLFDGATACTVNLLERVPGWVNLLLHLGMYVSYEVSRRSLKS